MSQATFPKGTVPYITQWSGESPSKVRVVVRRGRLAYADERSYDRDPRGVLWRRIPSMPGKGKPDFGAVHSLRQRLAMANLLCQVCGKPADRDDRGVLWLLGEASDDPSSWPQGLETAHPPVCRPCATLATKACPHLRRRYVTLRVQSWTPAGVHGAFYRPSHDPVPVDARGIPFDSPAIRWTIAAQLIVTLDRFTLINPTEM
ncbi:hypothetical protein ABT354_05910 [Streptomyces sp. NPDC000594]|uniref:hypothetical protein n=1 Tax=Streptomyces sp. NPDC000594 TaxID=3154261 RepID=UPI00331E3055